MTEPQAPPSKHGDEMLVDAQLDAYFLELAKRGTADLEVHAIRLPEHLRPTFRGRAGAQEWLCSGARGETASASEFRVHCRDASERAAFDDEVERFFATNLALPGDIAPGSLLDRRYLIQAELGRGGMGVVYAAHDQRLHREVAVKVFNALAAASLAGEWERITLAESRLLAALDSAHIVTVHDVRAEGERSFMVMDLVRGTSMIDVLREMRAGDSAGSSPSKRLARLRELTQTGTIKGSMGLLAGHSFTRAVARIAHAIAATVELAHERGILHRDLKPNNVMLLPGGAPMLLDFGLAARHGAQHQEREPAFRGTPEYFAPEQARSHRTGADKRTDIYQVGLLMYEMLTLRRAFARKEDEQIVAFLERVSLGVDAQALSALDELPASLAVIIRKALAADPTQRYSSIALLRADLERFLAGLPNQHARTNGAHALLLRARWVASRPASVAILLALLVGFGVAWAKRSAWDPPALMAFQAGDTRGIVPIGKDAASIRLGSGSGQVLGIHVESSRGCCLYAFSVFDTGDGEGRRVRPMQPELFSETPTAPPIVGQPLRVPGGVCDVVCTALASQTLEEGLLVYATEKHVDVIGEWQRRLAILHSEEGRWPGYDEALALGRALLGTARGDLVSEMSPEARAALMQSAPKNLGAVENVVPALRIKRFEQILRVEPISKE